MMLKKIIKLSEEEVNQMIQLQELFHNKYLNPDFLKQLIGIYVKAIQEFSDEIYKFMRNYFMAKMKFVLSRPETMKLLQGETQTADTIRQTVRSTEQNIGNFRENKKEDLPFTISMKKDEPIVQELQVNGENSNVQADRFPIHKQNHYHHHEKHHHKQEEHHHHNHYYHNESKNNQANAANSKLNMKVMLMREVQENMKIVTNQVNESDKKFVKKLQKVKDIGKGQQNRLKERLQKRRNKKLRKKSVQVVKPKVVQQQDQHQQPQQVIKIEELVEDQKRLTLAVNNFTIRMTYLQRKSNDLGDNFRLSGKMKMAKKLSDNEILAEEPEEEGKEEKEEAKNNKEKPSAIKCPELHDGVQGRVKTTRRCLDSDEEDN